MSLATRRPLDEIREKRRGTSRRAFLAAGAAGAASALLPWKPLRGGAAAPRIAIVGGGISGLTAALTLADRGVASTIYEASARTGGRMLSDRPSQPACGACHAVNQTPPATWLDGQVTDVFGELIDSGHKTMLSLAKRFQLRLIDLLDSEPAGATETYYFQGARYSKEQADADFKQVFPVLHGDVQAAGYPTSYNSSTAAGRLLDSMSIYDWIESRVSGGHSSPFGALLDVAYNIEYGAETTEQSALNLIYLLGYWKRSDFSTFGSSDERYRIADGIDLLPTAIARSLPPSLTEIRLRWQLEAIAFQSDGTYALSFDADGKRGVIADIVLLTLPFAVLRGLDYSRAGFDALKQRAIQELGRGHNGKLHLQFTDRLWNRPGAWGVSGGTSYSDTGCQSTWEATRGQPGSRGILVNYTGGRTADAMRLRHPYGNSSNPAVLADAAQFLVQIEPVFPGLGALWNGRAAGSMAHLSSFWNCSYSYWRTGQYQTFAGYECVRQGNVFFAGEHTSLDFQGWMEGGASSGVRAANEILALLR